jgi:hypothetical protein
MNSQDYRNLQEAYLDVYQELDEAVYGGEPKKVEEPKDTRLVVTNADKKGNTPAYQNFKKGDKRYRAADHMDEATAMAKRGYDEAPIRKEIANKTGASGAGAFADKATALADRETYGNKAMKAGRENLARKQRGDFRNTTSSSPGLRGYAYKSNDPEVKAKQDARGAQRGRAALTPNERKQLNMEFDFYDLVLSHLLDEGYADTNENALVIMANMSEEWRESILLDERIRDSPRPDKEEYMKRREIMRQNAKQAEREASTNNLIRSRKPPEPRKPDRVGNPSAATPSGEGLNPENKPPRPRVVTPYEPPIDPSTGVKVNLKDRTSKIAPFGTVKPPFIPPAAPKKIR